MSSLNEPAFRNYDAWLTTQPEGEPLVCPLCGCDSEEMEELEAIGLEGRGLLAYNYKTGRPKDNAYPVVIYVCKCGAVVADDGLVAWSEFYDDPDYYEED